MEQQAQPMIFKAIQSVMSELGAISKDRKNDQQGYRFRGIEDCYNALNPLFAKHGIFTSPRVVKNEKEVYANKNGGRMIHVMLEVEYDFFAIDGSKVTVGPIAAEGNDMSDKASNKAMSAAHKYAFIQVFSIPTEDLEDSDKSTVAFPAQESPKQRPAPPAVKQSAPQSPPQQIGNAGDYVITFGKKHSGKKLRDISDADLASYMTYIEMDANQKNQPIKGVVCDFMVNADTWLRRHETAQEKK